MVVLAAPVKGTEVPVAYAPVGTAAPVLNPLDAVVAGQFFPPGQTAAAPPEGAATPDGTPVAVAVRVIVERMVVGTQVEMVITETTGQLGDPGQTGAAEVTTPAAVVAEVARVAGADDLTTGAEVATPAGVVAEVALH